MTKFIQVGVIGLGKFGYKFGEVLATSGVNVLGIDMNPDYVQRAQHVFTQVLQADATNKEALVQMGLADLSHVLVSIGDSIAGSAMITMYLKELGVPLVWVKATNGDHAKLLKKLGVDQVIIPEHIAARQLANRVTIPGFIDHFPFNQEMVLKEMIIQQWAGETLRQLNLTNEYRIQVIAIKKKDEHDYTFIPKADDTLSKGDVLVVIGDINVLEKISS